MEFSQCHAALVGDQLVIGNAHVERRWRVENGLLYATSLRDVRSGREWLARPAMHPAPCPGYPVPDEPRTVRLSARGGRFGPTEAPSLLAELTAEGRTLTLIYRFQVFAASSGVAAELETRRAEECPLEAPAGAVLPGPMGVEAPPLRSIEPLPALDDLEHFDLAPIHLRLTQVTLVDQTDSHNELVFEDEWLLQPNEMQLALKGNLFIIEDTLTRAGLVLLKEAPPPHVRPQPTPYDLRVHGSRAGLPSAMKGLPFGPGHPLYPAAYQFAFYGHGLPGAGEGYRFVLLAYVGGRDGRIAALHDYQRQRRVYDPHRDGLFLTNTWGDRSQDTRIGEAFLSAEVESAARLGADVVQIDDGWQKGLTANSATPGGIWTGFWAADEHYWDPHPQRLPGGLAPIARAARDRSLDLGLWYVADPTNDYANWQRDAARILDLHRTLGVNCFKIDGVETKTTLAERNLRRFLDAVLEETGGRVVFDLDVTAGTRPGHFGLMHVGPVFVENRYTDFHRYWPHQTLRNLWKLAHYIDPVRLRMEFLNSARNASLYEGDPLAPGRYSPAYLFATVMFSSPLGWFEVSNLPEAFIEGVAPLVRIWKAHRERLFGGRTIPIGETPDGTAWTGFASIDRDGLGGYVLLFRELNDRPEWSAGLPICPESGYACEVLAGEGAVRVSGARLTARLPRPQTFLFARMDGR